MTRHGKNLSTDKNKESISKVSLLVAIIVVVDTDTLIERNKKDENRKEGRKEGKERKREGGGERERKKRKAQRKTKQ
jgi:hypothetical protein